MNEYQLFHALHNTLSSCFTFCMDDFHEVLQYFMHYYYFMYLIVYNDFNEDKDKMPRRKRRRKRQRCRSARVYSRLKKLISGYDSVKIQKKQKILTTICLTIFLSKYDQRSEKCKKSNSLKIEKSQNLVQAMGITSAQRANRSPQAI